MDCTFTGRTLILSKATKTSRDDSEQLREVMKHGIDEFVIRSDQGDLVEAAA